MSSIVEQQNAGRTHTEPEINFKNEVRTAQRVDRGIQTAQKRTERRKNRKSRSAWLTMFPEN